MTLPPIQQWNTGTGGPAGLGAALGTGLGSGLGSGLGKVLDARDTQKGLEAIGIKSDEARKLSFLHPSLLQQIVRSKQQVDQRQGLSAPGLQEIMPGLSEEAALRLSKTTPGIQLEFYRNFLKSGLPVEFADALGQEQQGVTQNPLQALAGGGTQQHHQMTQQQALSAISQYFNNPLAALTQQQSPFDQRSLQPAATPSQTQSVLQAPKEAPKQFAQRVQEARAKKEEADLLRKERKEAFKETKDVRKTLIDSKRAAENKLHDLDRFEELQNEGKIDTPGYVEFLDRSGLNIPALLDQGSEEFNKIQANFINGAKEAFGGRISNFELESFMKTVPNLSQSPEGRKRVIANLKRIERSKIARYDAYRDVLRKNGGVPPLDLEEQIEDITEPRMKAVTRQFRADLAKPVPKGQNKLITGLMAVAGSVAGAPGKLLNSIGGAAKGIGSLLL